MLKVNIMNNGQRFEFESIQKQALKWPSGLSGGSPRKSHQCTTPTTMRERRAVPWRGPCLRYWRLLKHCFVSDATGLPRITCSLAQIEGKDRPLSRAFHAACVVDDRYTAEHLHMPESKLSHMHKTDADRLLSCIGILVSDG